MSFQDSDACYAPPIERRGFSFDGHEFRAHIDSHRYPRENPHTLYTLLTYTKPPPVLTKKGELAKRQPEPLKDRPDHFYRAQLVHYGLKDYKTKDAAKKHLLASFKSDASGNHKLIVPAEIRKLEEDMKKDYKRANEKAVLDKIPKPKPVESKPTKSKTTPSEPKVSKPKAVETKKEVKPKVQATVAGTEKAGKGKMKAESVPAMTPSLKRKNEESDGMAAKRTREDDLYDIPLGTRTKQTARKTGTPVFPPAEPLAGPSQTMAAPVYKRTKQTARKSTGRTPPPRPNITVPIAVKGSKLPLKEISGVFQIDAPGLEEDWGIPEDGISIHLAPSSKKSKGHLWGSFDFGIITGIIRSVGIPPSKVGQTVSFKWRGYQGRDERQMTFGSSNTGTITYLGDGQIKGTIQGIGETEFRGALVANDRPSVKEWKAEWRSINDSMYEEASRARWGFRSWGSYGLPDGPLGSDTSGGEDNHEDSDAVMADPDDYY